jgi:hypothetical protein
LRRYRQQVGLTVGKVSDAVRNFKLKLLTLPVIIQIAKVTRPERSFASPSIQCHGERIAAVLCWIVSWNGVQQTNSSEAVATEGSVSRI